LEPKVYVSNNNYRIDANSLEESSKGNEDNRGNEGSAVSSRIDDDWVGGRALSVGLRNSEAHVWVRANNSWSVSRLVDSRLLVGSLAPVCRRSTRSTWERNVDSVNIEERADVVNGGGIGDASASLDELSTHGSSDHVGLARFEQGSVVAELEALSASCIGSDISLGADINTVVSTRLNLSSGSGEALKETATWGGSGTKHVSQGSPAVFAKFDIVVSSNGFQSTSPLRKVSCISIFQSWKVIVENGVNGLVLEGRANASVGSILTSLSKSNGEETEEGSNVQKFHCGVFL